MADSFHALGSILERVKSWLSLLPGITFNNLVEIVIMTVIVYEILLWIKNTRAWNLLKGLAVILILGVLAAILHLDTILWLLEKTATIAVTALIIIFQPELRRALEQLGSKNIITGIFSADELRDQQRFTERTANEIVKAAFEMAKVKTGALIVIERNSSLKEVERTGIEINGIVSMQLLINIFEHNTPLHDGAVVIRGNRITAATCYLPLSDNMMISKSLGTRHRAALGISETTDSVTIVVSEETGLVSLVEDGLLRRINDAEELRNALSGVNARQETKTNRFKIWKGRKNNERKAVK